MKNSKDTLPAEPTIATLSLSIIDDVRSLVQKQLELFTVELQERLLNSSWWIATAVVVGGVSIFAVQLLVVGAILYISDVYQLPLYQSFALTGVALFLLCLLGAIIAWLQLRKSGQQLESPKVFKQVVQNIIRGPEKTQ